MNRLPVYKGITYTLRTLLVIGVLLLIANHFLDLRSFAGTTLNRMITTNPDLEDGLVGHWTFDGDLETQVVDSSASSNHGFLAGSRSTSTRVYPGVIGQALEFNGSDEYVDLSSSETFSGTLTIAAWVYPETIGTTPGIALVGGSTANDQESITIKSSGATVNFRPAAGDNNISVSPGFATNEWQHIAVVRNSSDYVLVYRNGELVGISSGTLGGDFAPGLLGYRSNAQWDGYLDDVRFYNTALATSTITRLYELGATTHINKTITTNDSLEDGLVGHWTFDGDLETQITDRSGSGKDASLAAGSAAISTLVTAGAVGQALEFDGAADFVQIADASPHVADYYFSSEFTVAAWVYPDQFPAAVVGWDSYNENSILLTSNSVYGEIANATYSVTTEPDFVTGEWQHFVMMRDDTDTVTVYRNGVLAASFSNSNQLQLGNIGIGRRGNTAYYHDGKLDDVRLYDRAVSVTEIQRLYELGATTHINKTITTNASLEEGLAIHYTFDGEDIDLSSSTAEVLDRSGNGNDGNWLADTYTTMPGVVGQALEFFATTSDRIDTGVLNTDSFTYAAWIRPEYTGVSQEVFGTSQSGCGGPVLYINTSAGYGVAFKNCSTIGNAVSNGTISYGDWQHVAFTYDYTGNPSGDPYAYYYNGEPVSVGTSTGSVLNYTINIAASSALPEAPFVGLMDDARVYNRALSSEEVTRLYELGN